jgi:hypothetical protein
VPASPSSLPAVSRTALPAQSRALPPTLVGSVAALAVGTGIEWLARRMAGGAARAATRAAGRAIVPRLTPRADVSKPAAKAPSENVTVVDEIVYVRKVQLRR